MIFVLFNAALCLMVIQVFNSFTSLSMKPIYYLEFITSMSQNQLCSSTSMVSKLHNLKRVASPEFLLTISFLSIDHNSRPEHD